MTLLDQQVSVGALVMGAGTQYDMIDFNPWTRNVRADARGPRAWNHGSWSGAEFADEVVVPFGIIVDGEEPTVAAWTTAHQALAAAFAPSFVDIELRWMLDGATEYLMYGRPRMVEPRIDTLGFGYAVTRAAFVALDPLIYAGTESTTTVTQTAFVGGLLIPTLVPLWVDAIQSGGVNDVVNAGTAETYLTIRIDGPVTNPALTLRAPDGTTSTIRLDLTIDAGHWVEVDTRAETVFLDGDAGSSRRSSMTGDFFVLQPGTSVVQFAASSGTGTATLTWRSRWW
jgi:hypothetical protein